MKDKYLSNDKKVIPEEMDNALEDDIAQQRLHALRRAETLSSRHVMRQAKEISGRNFRIPEWAILRDDSHYQTAENYGKVILTFPQQFNTEPEDRIDYIVEAAKNSFDNCLHGVSEPSLQGFINVPPIEYWGKVRSFSEVMKNYTKNYLELARLSSGNTLHAWVEAQTREDRPILTLTNRAKPLKPICSRGRAQRPFVLEDDGCVYFVSGEASERILFAFPKDTKRFVACCIVNAIRPDIDLELLIKEAQDLNLGDLREEIPKKEPEAEPKVSLLVKFRDIIDDITENTLSYLRDRKKISEKEYTSYSDQLPFLKTLLGAERIISLADADERGPLLQLLQQKKKKLFDELEQLVPPDDYLTWRSGKVISETYVSVFDEENEDDIGFGMFGDEDELIPEPSEASEEISPLVNDDQGEDITEIQLGDSVDIPQVHVLWEPRFITEIRLWPHPWRYWEPP